MRELMSSLAKDCGLTEQQVEEGLAIVFQWLAGEVEEASWRELVGAVPEVGELGGPHRKKGFFGGLLGGAATALPMLGRLSRLGIGQDRLRPFLKPVVLYLRDRVDERLWHELQGQLPAVLFSGGTKASSRPPRRQRPAGPGRPGTSKR